MNYFSLQEYINELIKSDFIQNTVFEDVNCYIITAKVKST